jgi:hypothetical protein
LDLQVRRRPDIRLPNIKIFKNRQIDALIQDHRDRRIALKSPDRQIDVHPIQKQKRQLIAVRLIPKLKRQQIAAYLMEHKDRR